VTQVQGDCKSKLQVNFIYICTGRLGADGVTVNGT